MLAPGMILSTLHIGKCVLKSFFQSMTICTCVSPFSCPWKRHGKSRTFFPSVGRTTEKTYTLNTPSLIWACIAFCHLSYFWWAQVSTLLKIEIQIPRSLKKKIRCVFHCHSWHFTSACSWASSPWKRRTFYSSLGATQTKEAVKSRPRLM